MMFNRTARSAMRARPNTKALEQPAHWRARWVSLIDHVSILDDADAVHSFLSKMRHSHKPQTVGFVNAHGMNLAAESPEFHQSLMAADLVLRDGSGMAIFLRMLGRQGGLNMNGTDLIPRLLKQYQGDDIALFGTETLYLEQASAALRAQGHRQAIHLLDGFRPDADYVAEAQRHQPAFIVLAMGMPKQERVAAALKASLKHPCVIVCGGAIVDFIGGKVSRAPNLVRTLGMEWLYRLYLEPKRLFKRYVVGNPLFLWRASVTAVMRNL
jgi:N-acetylglucosaminyldiphosphoundecaprenol N-acetyl-beta-D-mannosaminyltransferase